ncbi:MAG: hypothetical protein Kow0059_13690 [Candidatus Sumerlaeia bacterium]
MLENISPAAGSPVPPAPTAESSPPTRPSPVDAAPEKHTGEHSTAKPEDLFAAANRHYAEGRYAEALSLYETLLARRWSGAALLYNAGNAAAQLGRKGLAVLYYERALRLSPRDEDAAFNLRFVAPPDNFPDVFILFRPFWYVRHRLLESELFALAAGFYLLGCASLAGSFVVRAPGAGRLARIVCVVSLVLAAWLGWTLFDKIQEERTAPPAIVMTSAVARSGPGETFKSVLELPEGLKVRIKGPAAPGWSEIQLLTGQTAFLKSEVLARISP